MVASPGVALSPRIYLYYGFFFTFECTTGNDWNRNSNLVPLLIIDKPTGTNTGAKPKFSFKHIKETLVSPASTRASASNDSPDHGLAETSNLG